MTGYFVGGTMTLFLSVSRQNYEGICLVPLSWSQVIVQKLLQEVYIVSAQ